MKNFFALIGLMAYLLASPGALARELIVALSPNLAPELATAQAKAVLQFLSGLEAGDRALLVDGDQLTLIGEFTVPDNPAYKGAKARLAYNRASVAALRQFAESAQTSPKPAGTVRLPQLLRHVSQNLSYAPQTDLIVLGSPFYHDPAPDGFSMVGGRFPGDGHLFASIAKTPFGASDNPQALKGLRVHLALAGAADFESEQHRFYVERFWTLFTEIQGGELVSFVPDWPTLVRRVRENATAPPHNHSAVKTDKLEMIRLQTRPPEQSIYERPISAAPLSPGRARGAARVQVGISWDCVSCDLDLYAQALPGSEVLYFNQPNTPEGRYWKDYRHSPIATNGYETIEFHVPLDLRTLKLAVNFYAGDAPHGVDGEIRIAVGDETFASPFHINAASGNQGQGMAGVMRSGQAENAQTLIIDPLRVVTLRPLP